MTRTVVVPIPGRSYEIRIGAGFLARCEDESLRPLLEDTDCVLVTDETVSELYREPALALLEQLDARVRAVLAFPPGEPSKTLATIERFYGACVRAEVDRKTLVIALGGGVAGDMAGFLAATYLRGLDFVQIPTTLLAQVDSSVGGKTGVDLPEGKNLVGAFHQPRHVLIDLDTLATLPERELRGGLAEVVKYGVILDADFFAYLEQHAASLLALDREVYVQVVGRCCELKAQVVLEDERELSGRRAILNYGHTFGHALEHLSAYAGHLHGEAVAIGMMMAADLAAAREPALQPLVDRQQALWDALGLPTRAPGVAPDALLAAMRADKKRERGSLGLILPTALGDARLVRGVDEAEVLRAIAGRCA